jgi:hypothetical protein
MKTIILTTLIALLCLLHIEKANAQTCQACFVATPSPSNPTIINLDALCSSTSVNNYEWYVDGALFTNFPLPVFQIPFTTTGTHVITLVVTGPNCFDSTSQTVNIQPGCDASFTTSQFGNNAYFSNTTYFANVGYSWDFGDGTTGWGPNITHSYATPGTYTVCCTSVDSMSTPTCNDVYCQTILISSTTGTCFADLQTYIDPSGLFYADGSMSQYDQINYSMQFYVNGTLVSNGVSTSYFDFLTQSGTYIVTLYVSDSTGLPCDSTSETIVFTGQSNNPCYACFVMNLAGPNYDSLHVDANCSNIPQGGSIEWTVNGQVLSNTALTQTLGFPISGNQYLTLTIKDSNGVACDSIFQTAYTYGLPCTSCLAVNQVSGSTSDYVFDASCGGTSTSLYYYFTVDNNYVAASTNPQFTYSFTQSGTYNVCVSSTDSLGSVCSSTCQTVVVNTPTVTQFSLGGTIFKYDLTQVNMVPTGAGEAKVYLIKLSTGGTLTAIDSTTTNAFGQYVFTNKPIDDYRVKAALETSSPDYAFNVPTYYQNGLMWYNAQVITLFGNSYGRDILLTPGINTGGNGFVGGNVYAGANKPSRNASASEVTLILMDQATNKPAAYAKPDVNGDYSFTGIPDGNYKIYGELLNRASVPETIDISAAQNTYTNKNFVFNDNVVKPTATPAAINNVVKKSDLTMYPNPASNEFTIVNTSDARNITIRDMIGKVLISFELKANERRNVNVAQWTRGVYMIQEEGNGIIKSNKILVQ